MFLTQTSSGAVQVSGQRPRATELGRQEGDDMRQHATKTITYTAVRVIGVVSTVIALVVASGAPRKW